MDNLYANDANYDWTEVTKLRFAKHWLEICVFFPNELVQILISYHRPLFFTVRAV